MRALLLSPVVKQRLTTFISGEKHTDMERLAGFMQDGTVTPAVGQRYSLERAPQALADLEAGRARGKAVVVVRQA
jgi:NADPH:quinone reductase-like Zn-dependent oxidoreductase